MPKFYRFRSIDDGVEITLSEERRNVLVERDRAKDGICMCDISGCAACLGLKEVPPRELKAGQECGMWTGYYSGHIARYIFLGEADMYQGVPITKCPPGAAAGAWW